MEVPPLGSPISSLGASSRHVDPNSNLRTSLKFPAKSRSESIFREFAPMNSHMEPEVSRRIQEAEERLPAGWPEALNCWRRRSTKLPESFRVSRETLGERTLVDRVRSFIF